MPTGKVASQAGHAYLDSYLSCADKERLEEYKNIGHGIKVCLQSSSLSELIKLHEACISHGITCSLVHDLGYTQFQGQETITALGFGPVRKSELPSVLRKLKTL